MITILHLSDLHRTSHPRMDNDELMSSIRSDTKRWRKEGISKPDLIVVSGDIVQGADVSDADSESELQSQYKEATELLDRLCREFVDSDRLRVVIVPGNHDVHWWQARQAMEPLEDYPSNVGNLAFSPTDDIRWSWKERRAFKITDKTVYEERCQPYKEFVNTFYGDINPNPIVGPRGDLFFSEYSDLNLAVVGLPSWCGNDCFCPVGYVDSATMAACQQLVSDTDATIKVAVWHHGVIGSPTMMDYMDPRVVHKLIDYGFQVGLHGHQHLTSATPFALNLPNLTSMIVVSAGSLAVGDPELPMGEHRQFNIVEIDERENTVKVNVRAMSSSGVFAGSHRNDFGGKSHLVLPLPASTNQPGVPKSRSETIAIEVFEAIAEKRFDDVLVLAEELDDDHVVLRRKVTIQALDALGRLDSIVKFLDPPMNLDEALKRIASLIELRRWDDADTQLNSISGEISEGLCSDIRGKIVAGRLVP